MSVVIYGIQKPKYCINCPLIKRCIVGNGVPMETEAPEDCPIKDIPEKHGRLIDADAFAENIKSIIERQGYDDMSIGKFISVKDVLEAVVTDLKGTGSDGYENAPTVIEAEEVSE